MTENDSEFSALCDAIQAASSRDVHRRRKGMEYLLDFTRLHIFFPKAEIKIDRRGSSGRYFRVIIHRLSIESKTLSVNQIAKLIVSLRDAIAKHSEDEDLNLDWNRFIYRFHRAGSNATIATNKFIAFRARSAHHAAQIISSIADIFDPGSAFGVFESVDSDESIAALESVTEMLKKRTGVIRDMDDIALIVQDIASRIEGLRSASGLPPKHIRFRARWEDNHIDYFHEVIGRESSLHENFAIRAKLKDWMDEFRTTCYENKNIEYIKYTEEKRNSTFFNVKLPFQSSVVVKYRGNEYATSINQIQKIKTFDFNVLRRNGKTKYLIRSPINRVRVVLANNIEDALIKYIIESAKNYDADPVSCILPLKFIQKTTGRNMIYKLADIAEHPAS